MKEKTIVKLRKITVNEFVQFVKKHPGNYRTVARNKLFSVRPWRDGVKYWINDDARYESNTSTGLARYVSIFNRNLDYSTKHYRKFFHKSYFLGVVRQIQEKLQPPEILIAELTEEETEIFKAPKTEREELQKSRIGQGRFRRGVIKHRKCCVVTGIADTRFLRASHIKPWSESTNEERLDPANGFLLSPNYDHLFDQAYISFGDDGIMLLSPVLTQNIRKTLGIDSRLRARFSGKRTKQYLLFHRARFQKKWKKE